MRPESLAHDEVGNPVPIHVGDGGAVQFREGDASGILRVVVVHHQVFDERDLAILIPLLFKPGKTPAMRLQAGHDVVESIPIYVVDANLAAAWRCPSPVAEGHRMVLPRLITTSGRRLLPPPVGAQNIHPSIAVNVACANAVSRPR